jgi:hypothetical protein
MKAMKTDTIKQNLVYGMFYDKKDGHYVVSKLRRDMAIRKSYTDGTLIVPGFTPPVVSADLAKMRETSEMKFAMKVRRRFPCTVPSHNRDCDILYPQNCSDNSLYGGGACWPWIALPRNIGGIAPIMIFGKQIHCQQTLPCRHGVISDVVVATDALGSTYYVKVGSTVKVDKSFYFVSPQPSSLAFMVSADIKKRMLEITGSLPTPPLAKRPRVADGLLATPPAEVPRATTVMKLLETFTLLKSSTITLGTPPANFVVLRAQKKDNAEVYHFLHNNGHERRILLPSTHFCSSTKGRFLDRLTMTPEQKNAVDSSRPQWPWACTAETLFTYSFGPEGETVNSFNAMYESARKVHRSVKSHRLSFHAFPSSPTHVSIGASSPVCDRRRDAVVVSAAEVFSRCLDGVQ